MKNRVIELTNMLNKYNFEYHNNNNSLVSDFEYDALYKELVKLEEEFPEYKQADSPTLKVGEIIDNRFRKVEHDVAMLSLDNAFSYDDLRSFDASIKKEVSNYSYVCELKIDGLAMAFKYVNGEFDLALTRGNGSVGEDVTHNIITMDSLVKTIPVKSDFEVRGEVYVGKAEFERLNHIQDLEGKKLFANPRNLASGTIRQLDSEVAKKRALDAFIYSCNTSEYETHFETLNYLKTLGFSVNSEIKCVSDIDSVIEYVEYWDSHRHELPYETDGIVIKVNEYAIQEELGFSARAPKWAIAYKYKAIQVETKINSITFQVGRTGKITPVANLDSVYVSGSTISRATLHNEDYIVAKDIQVGDTVLVHKAGEIIPEVVEVVISKRVNSVPFVMITNCPVCNSVLEKQESDAHYFCVNELCSAKMLRNLAYFASIDAMNIDGLGEKIVEILNGAGYLSSIIDIYELYNHREDLMKLDGFGAKRVDTLLSAIEQSKNNHLERFITGLGIKNVGKKVSAILVRNFNSLDKLSNVSVEELEQIDEIGLVIASSIVDYFKKEQCIELCEYVRDHNFNFKIEEIDFDHEYSKKVVCITGTFEKYKRKEIEQFFTLRGASVSSSVSKKTDYVIVGSAAGSKKDKAMSLNLALIEEEELNKIMEESNE